MLSTERITTERRQQKHHPLSVDTTDTVARSATMASPMIFRESSAVSPAGSCRSLPTPQRLFTSLNALAVPRPAGARAASEEDETEPTPQIKTSRSASEPEQSPKPPLFDLDSPYLPLLASSLQHGYMSDISGTYSDRRSNELVCRFRAAHRPPYMKNLSDPLDFASYGEVVTNTSNHLHLRVRFEHLHMVHTIKQAWVERHLRPDDTCVLRLSDPVLDSSVQSLDLTKTEPEDLLDALMPRQDGHARGVGDVVVGQHSTAAASPGPDHLSAGHAATPSTSAKPSIDKGTQASLPRRTNTADASVRNLQASSTGNIQRLTKHANPFVDADRGTEVSDDDRQHTGGCASWGDSCPGTDDSRGGDDRRAPRNSERGGGFGGLEAREAESQEGQVMGRHCQTDMTRSLGANKDRLCKGYGNTKLDQSWHDRILRKNWVLVTVVYYEGDDGGDVVIITKYENGQSPKIFIEFSRVQAECEW